MLPSNLYYINFNWLNLGIYNSIGYHIEMINNIPAHYLVKILLEKIFLLTSNLNGQFMFFIIKKTDGHQIFMKSSTDTRIHLMV